MNNFTFMIIRYSQYFTFMAAKVHFIFHIRK